MDSIQFFYEDTDYKLPDHERITHWILHTIEKEGFNIESINYIFCSDEYLHQVNVDYLNHDYYTDIITFDNSESDDHIESDIFISIDRVEDNSEQQGISFHEELKRVIIHGILHLVGYNDKSDEEKKLMREKENAYLSLPQFQ